MVNSSNVVLPYLYLHIQPFTSPFKDWLVRCIPYVTGRYVYAAKLCIICDKRVPCGSCFFRVVRYLASEQCWYAGPVRVIRILIVCDTICITSIFQQFQSVTTRALTRIIRTARLKFFGHITRADPSMDPCTAEHSGQVWTPYRGTGTSDHADLVKLGSAQLNLMSLHSALVWPIIEHKIDRHGGRSWKQLCPLGTPHDDDDDDFVGESLFRLFLSQTRFSYHDCC